MLDFKPLELSDKELINKYLKEYNFNTYEYSFATLYLWRKYCNIEYAITHDTLIIKKMQEDIGTYFMQPIGYDCNNISEIISELIAYKQSHSDMKALFRDIEETFLGVLRDVLQNNITITEDIDNFDYIYSAEELIKLPGKKFHGKKNHYNQFVKSYDAEINDVNSEEIINDCIELATTWLNEKEDKTHELICELEGIVELLTNKDYLGIDAMAVYVDGDIAGFSIGEKVNDKMAIIHIEKGDSKYQGIYAFVNRTFVEKKYSDVSFINREEDLGVEGLRKAKMSYNPVKFERKYIIN